eukprot:11114291-Heterocapsa_arctica.AAC.1
MHWLRPHGPMRILVSDQERGITGDEAAQWLDRWQIQMREKEPGTHAYMVERHHDIFRQMLSRVEAQMSQAGIAVPLEMIVAAASQRTCFSALEACHRIRHCMA